MVTEHYSYGEGQAMRVRTIDVSDLQFQLMQGWYSHRFYHQLFLVTKQDDGATWHYPFMMKTQVSIENAAKEVRTGYECLTWFLHFPDVLEYMAQRLPIDPISN